MIPDLDQLLAERGATHGDYADHARVTQRLKKIVADEALWGGKATHYADDDNIDLMIRESLDMILHKIGRIVAGDPTFRDHWDDIAGYARLVAVRLSEKAA